MLNVLLNIIGITLVLYSIFIIKKDISMNKNDEEEIITNEYLEKEIDIKDYYEFKDEIVEDFDLLMDSKVQLSKIEDKEIPIVQDQKTNLKDDKINPLHKNIMELQSIGLSNEEIAKKMGRGVREIDIILKIYKKGLK